MAKLLFLLQIVGVVKIQLEEEPPAGHLPGAGKLLRTHSKGALPSNSVAGEEGWLCRKTGESSMNSRTSSGAVECRTENCTAVDIVL